MINDLLEIGFFSGESAISDREIFYYSQLKQIKYKPYEVQIIKECAQVYVSGFYQYNDSIEMSPYSPELTPEEQDAHDTQLMNKMLGA